MTGGTVRSNDAEVNEKDERPRITFLTSSEYGQANVILAVVYELLLLQRYDINVASFSPLAPRIQNVNNLVPDNNVPAKFHTVSGKSSTKALVAKNEFIGPYPPGIRGAANTYRVTLPALATIWSETEYMEGYLSCIDILRSTTPDIIAADPIMSQGIEACKTLSRNYIVLSPNTFQEICRRQQPIFAQFCRWPAISSGFKYPVPWYLIPVNIFLKVMAIFIILGSPVVKGLTSWRQARGLPRLPPVFNIWQKENHYLCVSVPETEYPCYVPSNVVACGPILLPTPSISEVDSELEAWLQRGPTVMINLAHTSAWTIIRHANSP